MSIISCKEEEIFNKMIRLQNNERIKRENIKEFLKQNLINMVNEYIDYDGENKKELKEVFVKWFSLIIDKSDQY